MRRILLLLIAALTVFAVFPYPFAASGERGAASPSPAAGERIYSFAVEQDRLDWEYITTDAGNEFANGAARMANPRGRSFLRNITRRDADVAVEVKAVNESGPALAWILFRWEDAGSFYEVVLKKTHIEVWRKYEGRYLPILRRLDVELGDASASFLSLLRSQDSLPAPFPFGSSLATFSIPRAMSSISLVS